MKVKYLFAIIIFSLIFSNCSKDQVTSPDLSTKSGGLMFKIDRQNAPSNVVYVTAKLTRAGFTTITRTMNILTDTTAELNISNLSIGSWNLKVEAFTSSNVLVYSGEASVNIQEGITTQVSLVLQPVSTGGVGNIYIYVTWGSGTTPPSEWTDYASNPILSPQNNIFETGGVSHPVVIFDQNKYKMWFEGIVNDGRTYILYAESQDGKIWTRVSNIPVLSPGNANSWDSWSVQPGAVIKEGNQYRMYYFGYTNQTAVWHIGLAVSSDGISWEKNAEPILMGTTGWERQITVSSVVKVGSAYHMYYSGIDYPNYKMGLATSSDGIHWTRYSQNPILIPTLVWEGTGVYEGTVIYDENQFKMIYMNAGGNDGAAFGYATSIDGKIWQKTQNPVFRASNTKNLWGGYDIAYPYLLKDSQQLKLYYCGIGGSSSKYRIGLAYK